MLVETNKIAKTIDTSSNHKEISVTPLLDDKIIEVDFKGNIVWEWKANEHFHEFGFGESAKNIISRDPNTRQVRGGIGD